MCVGLLNNLSYPIIIQSIQSCQLWFKVGGSLYFTESKYLRCDRPTPVEVDLIAHACLCLRRPKCLLSESQRPTYIIPSIRLFPANTTSRPFCICNHWGTEAGIQTHLLGYIAMLGLYILSRESTMETKELFQFEIFTNSLVSSFQIGTTLWSPWLIRKYFSIVSVKPSRH